MLTLVQVQSIYDYGMLAYSQSFKNTRKEAIKNGAVAAVAATTIANPDAKMATKVKQAFLAAGMEAAVFNAHLSGNEFRIAIDKQIASSFKTGLEQLFSIENIKTNERQSFVYGKGYFLIGLYNEAITTLESAIIEAPSCIAHANYYLGKSNSCLRNHESAKNYFLWLLQREDDKALLSDYFDNLGMSYFAQGMYEEAVINYDLALQNNNENLSALHNKALVHLTLTTYLKDNEQPFENEYLNCQTLLNNIFDVKRSHPQALHTQAGLYELREVYEEAIRFYLQAREYCPAEDQETLFAIKTNLAECYAQSGHKFYQASDYRTAEDFYKKAIDEDSQHHIAKNQLGMCLFKTQDYNGARGHFNALVNFPICDNPSQEDRDNNREIHSDAWLNRAAALRKIGKFRLSKGSLDIAYDLSPNDPALQDETKALSATIIQQKYRFFKYIKQEGSLTQNFAVLTINS
jgi:tetratricopeptide (TPR) repeat protein